MLGIKKADSNIAVVDQEEGIGCFFLVVWWVKILFLLQFIFYSEIAIENEQVKKDMRNSGNVSCSNYIKLH